MNKVALLLGSNLGEREKNLQKAGKLIEEKTGNILETSKIYATAPWGNEDQPAFLNQAIMVWTLLSPDILMQQLLDIEHEMGRTRDEKWGARLIDIDILLYEDQVVDTAHLKIPHPHLHVRNFTLYPLNEIAAEWIHPVLKKTVNELLIASPDSCEVTIHV
ncbi:MAG: 2-amino-4-hydroxy-6-hydroxymethyldihydropteridine diphosphokinase [Bacteroidia bacterium]